MHACIHVCMYACMYACIYIHMFKHTEHCDPPAPNPTLPSDAGLILRSRYNGALMATLE